jgi:hypothetical protein
VQITVADVRDGACSSSTLKEAASWGKVDRALEQMVFAEATTVVPLIASDAYHRGGLEEAQAPELGQDLQLKDGFFRRGLLPGSRRILLSRLRAHLGVPDKTGLNAGVWSPRARFIRR